MDGGEQPQPQEAEVKQSGFIPAENPKFQRISGLMQERQQSHAPEPSTPPETQPMADAPAETTVEPTRKKEKAEKSDNQVRLETSLHNNIRLFSEGSDITARPDGKIALTDKGNVVAENISLLISREANGNFNDLKGAVAEVKRELRSERRKMQRTEVKRVRETFIAAGITPTKEQMALAVDATTSDQTKQVDAGLALLDNVYKQKRDEERKIAAFTRKAEVKDIASRITDDELAVFARDLSKEGKKAPPKALLKNMLAQRMRARTYSIDPIALRSHQMDTLIRDSQVSQPEIKIPDFTKPQEEPETPKHHDGFVPGLSDMDMKEMEKQQSMTPGEREIYKAASVRAAEEEAFNANRPNDALENETFADYRERTKKPIEEAQEKVADVGGFIPGLSTADTEELQRQARMNPGERDAYKAEAVKKAEDEARGPVEGPPTIQEQAKAEIERIRNGSLMSSDLPSEVRDIVIETLSSQEPPFTETSPQKYEKAETPTEPIKAAIIDFELKKEEIMANKDKSRFGKLKGWGRKAVAAALVAGALLGAVKASDHTSGAYSLDQAHEQPGHTQTVDMPPTSQMPDISISADNAIGPQQGPESIAKTDETQPAVDATVNEGEGLSQILKRVNGSFDPESPKDWKNVEQMLDLNRGQLEASNPQLYEKLDAARKENPQLSGEQIKDLIHQGGENYPVTIFTGQVLKTPSLQ